MLNKKYIFVTYLSSMVPKLKANMNKFNSASLPREADLSLFCREVKLGTKGKIFKDTEVPEDGEKPFGICRVLMQSRCLPPTEISVLYLFNRCKSDSWLC